MPRAGCEKLVRKEMKPGSSRSLDTDPDMVFMPNISTAKPMRMSPTWCRLRFFATVLSSTPATAVSALRDSVLSSCSAGDALPDTPDRQIIHPVMLVPMTAPMITAIAWRSFIMAEFTKPTTITLVADEDWITAVTPVPSKMPLNGVEERR